MRVFRREKAHLTDLATVDFSKVIPSCGIVTHDGRRRIEVIRGLSSPRPLHVRQTELFSLRLAQLGYRVGTVLGDRTEPGIH